MASNTKRRCSAISDQLRNMRVWVVDVSRSSKVDRGNRMRVDRLECSSAIDDVDLSCRLCCLLVYAWLEE